MKFNFFNLLKKKLMSLKQKTQNLLFNQIKNLPPLMLEELIGFTKEKLHSEIETKIYNDLKKHLPYIITAHMKEYINSKNSINRQIIKFDHVPSKIQLITLETAEIIVDEFEEQLVSEPNQLQLLASIYGGGYEEYITEEEDSD